MTAGASLLAAPALAAGTGYAGGTAGIHSGNKQRDKVFTKVVPEFQAACLNYKIKRLIAKGRTNIEDVVSIVRRYK